MQNELNGGLLSGKYDSTKQRAVLLNGDRFRNYRSYTATMRMELLLVGHLVLTDAQFFDGLYFHWLAQNTTEFEAFQRRMLSFEDRKNKKEKPFSIAVKCRGDGEGPNLASVVFKMYGKQFQFSSIEHDDLAKAVFELSNDFSESYFTGYDEKCGEILKKIISHNAVVDLFRDALGNGYAQKIRTLAEKTCQVADLERMKKPGKPLEKYIDIMTEYLSHYKGEKSSIVRNWKDYSEQLKVLFEGVENKVDRWGTGVGNYAPDWKIDQCLKQEIEPGSGETYRQRMEELLMQAGQAMEHKPLSKRYFCRIRDELNRNIRNRSKITTSLDELENMLDQNNMGVRDKAEEEVKKKVRGYFKEFRQLMNDRYNKTLAVQHGCEFLDLCDYTRPIEQLGGAVAVKNIVIPTELVKALAELSWDKFDSMLECYQDALTEAFAKWMSAYKRFSKDDIEELGHALQAYLDQLASIVTKEEFRVRALEPVKPWDKAGTCDDEVREVLRRYYRYPYYFVGGGSFEEGSSKGNEICLLC